MLHCGPSWHQVGHRALFFILRDTKCGWGADLIWPWGHVSPTAVLKITFIAFAFVIKAAVGNFEVNINELLVSDVVWKYLEISVFFRASVLRIGENPIAPVLFAQSVTLSVLSVLISLSMPLLSNRYIGTS